MDGCGCPEVWVRVWEGGAVGTHHGKLTLEAEKHEKEKGVGQASHGVGGHGAGENGGGRACVV